MVGIGCKLRLMNIRSDWVTSLVHIKFFGPCVDHEDLRKNEKNMFCIDCNLCFCKHCINSPTSIHRFHRSLQICKYVYHDVVRLQDIQKYLDCSEIQTYKINGEKAVHLNPRPHRDSKSTKPKSGVPCEACGRHIQDSPNRFCSIACKVLVVVKMCNDNKNETISTPIQELGDLSLNENDDWKTNTDEKEYSSTTLKESSVSASESSEEFQAWRSSTLKPKKQSHKRKGFPRRAPFH